MFMSFWRQNSFCMSRFQIAFMCLWREKKNKCRLYTVFASDAFKGSEKWYVCTRWHMKGEELSQLSISQNKFLSFFPHILYFYTDNISEEFDIFDHPQFFYTPILITWFVQFGKTNHHFLPSSQVNTRKKAFKVYRSTAKIKNKT